MVSLQKNSLMTASHQLHMALSSEGPVVAHVRQVFPRALAVYAFGSRIHGTARADSDLDLAVLVDGVVDALQLWDAAQQLTDVVGCSVDLLDLRTASTVMQFQVLSQGRALWAVQPQADLFACFVWREKWALDAARSGILDDIVKRGRVYG
jgi:uncharacterized protein